LTCCFTLSRHQVAGTDTAVSGFESLAAHPYLPWPSGILPSSNAAFSVPEQQREQQQASLAVPVLAIMIIAYVLPEHPGHPLGS
jgi:hypothetical protein